MCSYMEQSHDESSLEHHTLTTLVRDESRIGKTPETGLRAQNFNQQQQQDVNKAKDEAAG